MTNTTDRATSDFFVCDLCGRTNWYSTSLVDEDICGGCVIEGAGSESVGTIGAGGIIKVNANHECRRREFIIDISLICAIVLVVVLGSLVAIVKNRRRKSSNQEMHGTQ